MIKFTRLFLILFLVGALGATKLTWAGDDDKQKSSTEELNKKADEAKKAAEKAADDFKATEKAKTEADEAVKKADEAGKEAAEAAAKEAAEKAAAAKTAKEAADKAAAEAKTAAGGNPGFAGKTWNGAKRCFGYLGKPAEWVSNWCRNEDYGSYNKMFFTAAAAYLIATNEYVKLGFGKAKDFFNKTAGIAADEDDEDDEPVAKRAFSKK